MCCIYFCDITKQILTASVDQHFVVDCGAVLFMLLLIFINDLPSWIRHSMLLLFADDSKLCRRILDKHDEILLQEDLDSLVDWTKKWCLQLNIDK